MWIMNESYFVIVMSILVLFIVGILCYVFRREVRKYWKYFIIVVPFLLVVILRFVLKRRVKDMGVGGLMGGIKDVREDIEEVRMEYIVETSASRSKNEEVLRELERIKGIRDKKERRRRLAGLIDGE